MPPGLMLTSEAAIFFDAGKLWESTMRTSPPEVFFVGAIVAILNVYWMGDATLFPPADARSCANDPGRSAGNIYSSSFGNFRIAPGSRLEFFVMMYVGVCATHSEMRKVLS